MTICLAFFDGMQIIRLISQRSNVLCHWLYIMTLGNPIACQTRWNVLPFQPSRCIKASFRIDE